MTSVLEVTGSRNHESLPEEHGLLEELDRVLWHMDEPFTPPAATAIGS